MTFDLQFFLKDVRYPKRGIATYLQYRLSQIWPDLYGLSLLTLGHGNYLVPQTMWYPANYVHGQFLYDPLSSESPYFVKKTCYLSPNNFPFQECSMDRIVYLHDTKINKYQFQALLRSCWKTLCDHGKMMFLIPNRLGWWSLIDNLALRFRNTFLMQKINRLLTQHLFRISYYERVLYFPPQLMNRLSLCINRSLDFIGLFFVPFLGGYHLIEIEKNLFAPITMAPLKKNYILQSELSKSISTHRNPLIPPKLI
ncbi:hypothetical protein COMNV_00199 [Commensalibacter sp. Nvir]|uniref:hypothetical protein n=1 Tax=Commensalibacter sp. Nvir TaxID=3069817 RepID=UPI002D4B0340|nr:hypothetical protein COMNV_00199 [Commensalibacter sp. Nvir]